MPKMLKTAVPAALKAAKGTIEPAKGKPTGNTFLADNGLSYERLDNGAVRRTYPDLPTDAELSKLDKGSVKQRMKALYALLRAEAPDETVQKASGKETYIYCRGYKMRYTPEAFEMLDGHNFYRPSVKFNPVDNSARAVADFIFRRNINREVAEKVATEKTEITPLNQMHEAIAKAAIAKANKVAVLKKEVVVEKSLEDMRTEALALIAQARNRSLKPTALLEVIQNLVPFRTLKVRIGKLLRSYENKEMRLPKLLEQLQLTVSDVSFDTRKAAPKFLGVDFYDLVNVTENGPEHLTLTPRTGTKFTTTRSEFMARYVLSIDPDLMPMMMKVLDGQEYAISDLQEVDFVVRDKFVEYSEKAFSKITPNAYLEEVCNEYLAHVEQPSPLGYLWGTSLKKGDKVRVLWQDYYTYHNGTITSANDGPCRVRYEDGTTMELHKHQPVKLIK